MLQIKGRDYQDGKNQDPIICYLQETHFIKYENMDRKK